MDLRLEVVSQIDEIVDLLKHVPPDEIAFGWDSSRVQHWMAFFDSLRGAVARAAPLATEYRNATLLRWLDAQSICGGRIADRIIKVEGGLRKLVVQEAAPN